MKSYVRWEVQEGNDAKEVILKQLEHIEKSGKMKHGGVLLGVRGGYFIFDIEKPSELLYLLGTAIFDNCHVESYPVVSYKELGEFLKEDLKKAA